MDKIQIIFDFDGVILNSHKVKTKAFEKIFENYGKKISHKAKNYHLQNIGISRFKKFNFIKKNIIKNSKISNKVLNKKFNLFCMKKINKLNVSIHLLKFFKKNFKSSYLYVSTATPHNTIVKILKTKKIYRYFKKVYGSPSTKVEHINKIKKNKLKTFFIGDSKEDYESSIKTKTIFILREHSENKKYFQKRKIIKIRDFRNLEKIIFN